MSAKLLLHVCCAPCSIMCIETFRAENLVPALFWYNPNIHPYTEYVCRRDCLAEHARRGNLDLVMKDQYGLREFLASAPWEAAEGGKRCAYCYRTRLQKTARAARENGFGAFSTTLLVSPYQNHGLLQAAGEEAAETCGVEFVYRDWRPRFREGQARAKAAGYYMQKYCGCVFSEEERYTAKSGTNRGA